MRPPHNKNRRPAVGDQNLLQPFRRVNMTGTELSRTLQASRPSSVFEQLASPKSSRKQGFLLLEIRVSYQVKVT
jgi:hypothetical protein